MEAETKGPARVLGDPPDPPGGARRPAPALSRWLRVAVTALLVAWVVVTVEWTEFGRTVLATDLLYLALAVLVSPLLVLVNTWKWRMLLRPLGVSGGFGTCFQLYLLSKFFNNILPTHVGGDVLRGIMLGRPQGRTAPSLASVAVERVTGLSALLLLALAVLAWDGGEVFPPLVSWGALGAVGALLCAMALILSPGILARVRARAHLPLVGKLERFQSAVQQYRGHPRALLAAFAVSFAFYALAVANVFLSARAFGAPLGPAEAAVATPVLMLIMLFPVSVGGLGLTEWAYIFVLGLYGVSPEVALSTALLMRAKTILLGLAGALLYAARSGTSPRPVPDLAREPAATGD